MPNFLLSRSFETKVEPTDNVKACAAMFGIGADEEIRISLYEDLNIRVDRGRIVLLTGESGAGKSCCLRDVMEKARASAECVVFADVGQHPDVPIVDQFPGMDIKDIGALLASVGISEAFVYLRKPGQLSDGQRYRFSLATMIYRAMRHDTHTIPVIFIDEFLAFLDRETARNVAYQVRRAATKHGLCFVVATTHQDIAEDLQANQTVTMRLCMVPDVKLRPLAGR